MNAMNVHELKSMLWETVPFCWMSGDGGLRWASVAESTGVFKLG